MPHAFITDPSLLPTDTDRARALRKRLHALPAKALDELLLPVAQAVRSQIDCTRCANCCKQLEADVTSGEIETLADGRGTDTKQFQNQHTKQNPEGSHYLASTPCMFLTNNLCRVYQSRPQACATFPYLDAPLVKFRLHRIVKLYGVCPIVYNTLELTSEALKQQVSNNEVSLASHEKSPVG